MAPLSTIRKVLSTLAPGGAPLDCPACAAPIDVTDDSCPDCDVDLAVECRSCGEAIEAATGRCSNCGSAAVEVFPLE